MIALLQRVAHAQVTVDDTVVGAIDQGLLVLVCAVRGDTEQQAQALAQRVLRYRIFEDDAGKMNRSASDIGADILVVSQFTLAADTSRGNRPSFTPAAEPELARALYETFVQTCRQSDLKVQTGRFGAHMRVTLLNDGPVTIWLEN